jgi:uncharacterized protein
MPDGARPVPAADAPPAVEAIPADVCWDLIARMAVGRVAVVRRRAPIILPVNFKPSGHTLLYRTSSGSTLVPAGGSEDLAFEVDGVDEGSQLGWSVLVKGRATVVRDVVEATRLSTGLHAWAPGPHDVLVRIEATEVTGRQVVRTAGQRPVEAQRSGAGPLT